MKRLRRAVTAIVLAAVLGSAATAAADVPRPQLRADAAILVDARTGDVLLERRADDRRAIASATKLMTALLALERARLDQVFTAPEYRALPVESKIDLREGERMRVDDLLEALLLESANDAAVAIAVNLAGSRQAFVDLMNARAAQLGLDGTRFANPIGLDDPDNHSTARDLAELTRRLLANREFARIVDKPMAVLESGARRRVVDNRNRLVGRVPFVTGVKTGHTRRAGYVLVGSATGRGAHVVSVVLGEPSEAARDRDTLALLRFGLDRFRRVPVIRAGAALAHAGVKWHGGDRIPLAAPRTVALTVRRGQRPRIVVDAPDDLEGPIAKGRQVGSARVVLDGRTLRTVPLVAAEPVPGAGTLRRLFSGLGVPLTSLLLAATLLAATLVGLRIRAVRRARTRA